MKKHYLSLLFLMFSMLCFAQGGTSTNSIKQPCSDGSIYVVVTYYLEGGKTFSNKLTWGSYTDNFSSGLANVACGGGFNNATSLGHILFYKNSGCNSNPNKQALDITASCSNCTGVRIYSSLPAEWGNCRYKRVSRR